MIAVIYGTTGELIKLAPVLRRLDERRGAAFTVCTGQQVEQIPGLLDDISLRQPDVWLRNRHRPDLERPRDIPPWLIEVALAFARRSGALRRRLIRGARPLVIVHGDTFTTLLGALMGRVWRVPVAHIEAGMRSGTRRNPFPEEVIRRRVSRLAQIHFAPNERAAAALAREGVRGRIVETGANTIRDSLELAAAASADEAPDEPFGLVSLHRFELLEDAQNLRTTIDLLREASRRQLLLFVDHPVTAAAVKGAGLTHLFDERFRRIPRRPYTAFLALLKASEFLVTDSGGSQEECAYLGHPCLVHRAVTEHATGLDSSVVLSRMNPQVVRRFLDDPQRLRIGPQPLDRSPTETIVSFLSAEGFLV